MLLTFVGAGVKGPKQMSIEAFEAIKTAKKVLLIRDNNDQEYAQFMQQAGIKNIEFIDQLYVNGALDRDNYSRLFEKINADVLKYQVVCCLIQGHPRVGVSIMQMFERDRPQLPFDLNILAGISSFDTMINDLAIDPLERGTALLEANRLLLFEMDINPYINNFIYHICSIGTSYTHINNAAHDNKVQLLMEHLLRYYPADHKVLLLESANESASISSKVEVKLAELEMILNVVSFSSTLYLPAMKPQSINRRFLELLRA